MHTENGRKRQSNKGTLLSRFYFKTNVFAQVIAQPLKVRKKFMQQQIAHPPTLKM